ncbi:hypothetical protein CDAR_304721 [Caerostris darwini]|uniref:Uncharacterized protein n=1 Tax=Caerostris darwini TaxID=1538125 RepID=A0AAV4PUZ5_9ARAC|nr:hypothetical protein CDAR_304721 [Caerostris darwini]
MKRNIRIVDLLSFPTALLASPRAVVHQNPSSSAYRVAGSVNRVRPLAGESSFSRLILTHHSETDYVPNESSSQRKVALAKSVLLADKCSSISWENVVSVAREMKVSVL